MHVLEAVERGKHSQRYNEVGCLAKSGALKEFGAMSEQGTPLAGLRVLAALNGLELFGHERGNIEVYKTIRGLGAAVTVGVNATEDGGDVGRLLRELGFPTVRLPFGNQWSLKWLRQDPLSIFSKLRSVLGCSFKAWRFTSQWLPTHILLGSPLVFSYLSLALAACRVPLIYRMGDCPPFGSPFNLWIWRLAMRRSSQVVAISDFVRREAKSGGVLPDRISMIHNLVPCGAEASGRFKVRLAEEGAVVRRIVYVGSIAEHKGVRHLILACAILRRRFPDLVLDVVGGSRYDAQYRGEIQELIRDKELAGCVFMHGYQDDPTPFYSRADVHVAPSLCEEALGSVALEAKREGVPSVVFRSGGLPEVVRDGVDGVVCEEKSPEALATGIAALLEDPDRRRAAGQAAREDFEARFGPERFAREWAEVFLRSPHGSTRDRASQGGGRP